MHTHSWSSVVAYRNDRPSVGELHITLCKYNNDFTVYCLRNTLKTQTLM